MKEKAKAKELVDKYLTDYGEKEENGSFTLCIVSIGRAKQCALIAVDLMLAELDEFLLDEKAGFVHYFELVKQEINKL